MLISDEMSVHAIACELNRRGVEYDGDSKWDYQAVYAVLTHPKYSGCHVFGQSSSKLYTRVVRLPKSAWVFTPGAFEPIVDHAIFSEAQRILQERTINRTDEELLESLRALLAKNARLSLRLIQNSEYTPSPSTYRQRFGSLRRAYELIGYGRPAQFGPIDLRRRTQGLRDEVIGQITKMFPDEVSIVRRGGRWRSQLRMENGWIVSVLVARSVRVWKDTVRWRVDPVPHEIRNVILLARLDKSNRSFLDFHVLQGKNWAKRFDLRFEDDRLEDGWRLGKLSEFYEAIVRLAKEE